MKLRERERKAHILKALSFSTLLIASLTPFPNPLCPHTPTPNPPPFGNANPLGFEVSCEVSECRIVEIERER